MWFATDPTAADGVFSDADDDLFDDVDDIDADLVGDEDSDAANVGAAHAGIHDAEVSVCMFTACLVVCYYRVLTHWGLIRCWRRRAWMM